MVTVDLPIIFEYKHEYAVFNGSRLNKFRYTVNDRNKGSFFGARI